MPAIFFLVVTLGLLVIKKKEFLWLTSLPCLGFYLTLYVMQIIGIVYFLDDFLLFLLIFQPIYDTICVVVIFLRTRGSVQGVVPTPLYIGGLIVSLFHPSNINTLSLFVDSLEFEVLQLGSSFSLAKLVSLLMMVIYASKIVVNTSADTFDSTFSSSRDIKHSEFDAFLSYYMLYVVIASISGFSLIWELTMEVTKWFVARTSIVQTQGGDTGGPESMTQLGPKTSSSKRPGFGERPLNLDLLNDVGSTDSFTHQSSKHGAKRTKKLLEPLLDAPDEEGPVARGKAAPYEPSYCKFFAWSLFPLVLLVYIPLAMTIIGLPLARLSVWRFRLAFGGSSKSVEGRKHVQYFSFAASRGLFLFPISFVSLFVVFVIFLVVVSSTLALLALARGVASALRFDTTLIDQHISSQRGALLFVSSCLVWSFVPLLPTLPSVVDMVSGEEVLLGVGRVAAFLLLQVVSPLLAIILALFFPYYLVSDHTIVPPSIATLIYAFGSIGVVCLLIKLTVVCFASIPVLREEGFSANRMGGLLWNFLREKRIQDQGKLPQVLTRTAEFIFAVCIGVETGLQLYLRALMSEQSNAGVGLAIAFCILTIISFVAQMISLLTVYLLVRKGPLWFATAIFVDVALLSLCALLVPALSVDPCHDDNTLNLISLQRCSTLQLDMSSLNVSSIGGSLHLNFTQVIDLTELRFVNVSGVSDLLFNNSLGFPFPISGIILSQNVDLERFETNGVLDDNRFKSIISSNPNLVSVAFESLPMVYESSAVNITFNQNLANLTFDSLATIQPLAALNVISNGNLGFLDLRRLQDLDGTVSVASNQRLSKLSLNNLQTIGGLLYVANTNLVTLDMTSVSSMNGSVVIASNPALSALKIS